MAIDWIPCREVRELFEFYDTPKGRRILNNRIVKSSITEEIMELKDIMDKEKDNG